MFLLFHRYMSTPEDNPDGYNRTNPLWRVDNLRYTETVVKTYKTVLWIYYDLFTIPVSRFS